MTALDIFTRNGNLVISSETIADGSGVQHKNVLEMIDVNRSDFEDFGEVAFETRPFATAGGTQVRRVALLNEPQATLLMTFQRNTDQVRAFKKALVKSFFEMARRSVPQSLPDALRAFALEVEAREALEAKVQELEPAAAAWDELASATGDYEVADAAKMLARAGVMTGRTRLFEQLSGIGWIYRGPQNRWRAYQAPVSDGYVTEKPMSHHHPRTGEVVLDPPQVRVTVRGLERLRVRLGSVDLELAS